MARWLTNVFHLGLKEFASLGRDRVLLVFIVYAFSIMIYSDATGVNIEVTNANVAVVDSDRSQLSRRIADALLMPQFKTPLQIDRSRIDDLLDSGRVSFVLDIPPRFEADVLAERSPSVQINIDATAMTQAGIGASYIEEITTRETMDWLRRRGVESGMPVNAAVRVAFNPNLDSIRFQAVMSLIQNITMISILLVGAAVIREREHGTIEHLLVMPLSASEIAAAKIWANAAVVLLATALSVLFMLNLVLGVPTKGSLWLFLATTGVYLFAMTALGLLLATIVNSMPQFALIATPTFIVLTMLSGATSPLESMPFFLRTILQASPSVHYTTATHSILFRGAGVSVVWPQMLILFGLGSVFLAVALAQFRAMLNRQTA